MSLKLSKALDESVVRAAVVGGTSVAILVADDVLDNDGESPDFDEPPHPATVKRHAAAATPNLVPLPLIDTIISALTYASPKTRDEGPSGHWE